MNKRLIFLVSIVCFIDSAVAKNSSNIGNCNYYGVDKIINDNITFICGDNSA